MAERAGSRLPKSVKIHNRNVLAEARRAQDPRVVSQAEEQVASIRSAAQREQSEWENFQGILVQRVEGYPENFSPLAHDAIRGFFSLRRRLNELSGAERTQKNIQFTSRYPEEVLDLVAPVFSLITQSTAKQLPKSR